jgi:hypothetical protein
MALFYSDLSFMSVIQAASRTLRPADVGRSFAFCHVDGGHSASETYSDLSLAANILLPAGLVAIDDYFNSEWPGVSEGTLKYLCKYPKQFRPLAIGFNKVLLQKRPSGYDLNKDFGATFPDVRSHVVQFLGSPTLVFSHQLSHLFDLQASTPARLQPRVEVRPHVRLHARTSKLVAHRRQKALLMVDLTNESDAVIRWNTGTIGVSYHLYKNSQVYHWDNDRILLTEPILPRETQSVPLVIVAPEVPGEYEVEVDLVWESVTWMSERDLATKRVPLLVS